MLLRHIRCDSAVVTVGLTHQATMTGLSGIGYDPALLISVVRRLGPSSAAAHFQGHVLQLLSNPPSPTSISFFEHSPCPCLSPRALAYFLAPCPPRRSPEVEILGHGRLARRTRFNWDRILEAPLPLIRTRARSQRKALFVQFVPLHQIQVPKWPTRPTVAWACFRIAKCLSSIFLEVSLV